MIPRENKLLKTWLKIIKTGLVVFGALLSFFVFIEVLRAYQTLYELHPTAGYAFIAVIAAGLLWLAAYLIKTVASQPPVLIPPRIGDPQTAKPHRIKRYAKYLIKYMTRLSCNPSLPTDQQEKITAEINNLSAALQSSNPAETLAEHITKRAPVTGTASPCL